MNIRKFAFDQSDISPQHISRQSNILKSKIIIIMRMRKEVIVVQEALCAIASKKDTDL